MALAAVARGIGRLRLAPAGARLSTAALLLGAALPAFGDRGTSTGAAPGAQHSAARCTTAAAPGSGLSRDEPLRLLTWNVQKQTHPGWREDIRRLAENQDFVLLQEARLSDKPAVLPEQRSAAAGFTMGGLRTGVTIDSRHKPWRACEFQLQEPWLGTPKALAAAYYHVDGSEQDLLVITLHGVNFTIGTRALRAQLAAAESLLARHRGPALVAGDINTWSERRSELLSSLARRQELCPLVPSPDERTRVFGRPVDHVLSRGLEI